jgi:hypothetical protein
MPEIVGKSYNYITVCELGDDGKWEVTGELIQGRRLKDSDWEAKEIKIKTKHNDLEKATGDVYVTIMEYLVTVEGDLFNEPEKGTELLQ